MSNINSSLGIDTKLDAINQVISAIGSVGINSLDEVDSNIDAAEADKTVDVLSQRMQNNLGKGWWFNRESFHKLVPDAITGRVNVPSNTMSAFVKRARGGGVQPITLRGTTLFDTESLGYDMRGLVNSSGYIDCILVVNLPFEYLPDSAKIAITDASRFEFCNDKEGDTVKLKNFEGAADTSYIGLQSEDASQKRRNMLSNRNLASTIGKVGGFNNN